MPPTWILFVLVCGFWLYYVLRPLFRASPATMSEHDRLQEEKRGYLFALRDAESDHVLGVISEDDYRAARSRLEAEVTRMIEAIDRLQVGGAEARVEARMRELEPKGQDA
jgi:hypothetical protein